MNSQTVNCKEDGMIDQKIENPISVIGFYGLIKTTSNVIVFGFKIFLVI